MNIKNKIKKLKMSLICISLTFIFIFISKNTVEASNKTKAEIGGYIAEFAINFYNQHNSETVYDWTAAHRAAAYRGEKIAFGYTCRHDSGVKEINNMYPMDCVGWVSMCIHQSTGLDSPNVASGACGFVTPQGHGASDSALGFFDNLPGNTPLQAGDILVNYTQGTHVMVYVGDGKIVDSTGGYSTLQYRQVRYYDIVTRISDVGVAAINDENLTTIFQGQGSISGTYEDQTSGDNGFEYQGTANGVFGSRRYNFDWVINKLLDIVDWFVGIVTYLFRMIAIGWTAVVERLINNVMEWTTGEEASLTIEKLVNNKVPLLDVNFFNFSTAGGMELNQDSVIYVVRENIAAWYYMIRIISIIGLLVVLLYLGVRMAFSSFAEQKAKYKEMLISWAVSFLIVFFIHYVMVIILRINESLIDLINVTLGGGEESLFDAVRSSAYAIQASVGLPALIMYIALVYLLVKFLFVYFKRFLVVGILTFMAPIIGVLYSVDKIKDNKSQSLSNWLKEYSFNVLLQSVHALLYALFVSLALNVLGSSIMGGIIAVLLINFILVAEKIFKKIFGIKSGSIKDTLKTAGAISGAAGIVKGLAKTNAKVTGIVLKPITKPTQILIDKTKEYKRKDKIENIKNSIDEAVANGGTSIKVGKSNYDLSELINNNKFNSAKVASKIVGKEEAIKKQNKKQAKTMLDQAFNTVAANAEFMAGLGMTVINPEIGGGILSKAKRHHEKSINGCNKENKHYRGKASGIKNIISAGLYNNIKNIQGETKSNSKKIKNNAYNTQHEIAIKNAKKRIGRQLRELQKNPNINQKELEKLYKDMSEVPTEKLIFNITYQIEATVDNTAFIKKGKTNSDNSVYKSVDDATNQINDINSLHAKILEISRGQSNSLVKIDKDSFEEGVKTELVNMIAKETKKRKSAITQSEIDTKLKNMDTEEKRKLLKQQMFNSTKLTDKAEEKSKQVKKQKSNMSLQNVKEIIDTMSETTSLPINKMGYKRNFEDLIKNNIAEKEAINLKDITQQDIDKYIKNMSNSDLIFSIKSAGGYEGSMRKNKNASKPEFAKLVEDLEKVRYHKSQLKGE